MSASLQIHGGLSNDLGVEPFGAVPNWGSRIAGLGGPDPSPDPSYVFRTVPVRPGLGSVTFTVRFFDLAASCGTLRLNIRAVPAFPGAEPVPLETLSVPLAELVAAGGLIEARTICHRNTLYEIAANIDDESDISCSGIAITVDRSTSSDERGRSWGYQRDLGPKTIVEKKAMFIQSWMTRLDAPDFENPTSQGWTAAHARHPEFRRQVGDLRLGSLPPEDAWAEAQILQALDAYGVSLPNSSGLAFVTQPHALPSLLVARGCEMVLNEHAIDPIDPGLALERHYRPELCDHDRFFDHAFFTPSTWWDVPPYLVNKFDFLWSINANRVIDADQFLLFVLVTIACLKPGGLAIHVFDHAEPESDTPRPDGITRSRIERIATHALSHLNEVALLRFRGGTPKSFERGSRSFALILRQGRPG